MTYPTALSKFLPALALPLLLASCGGVSTPSAAQAAAPTPISSAPVAAPAPKPALADAGTQSRGSEEDLIFAELNAARATGRYCGDTFYPAAPALTWNGYLATAARAHAQDMADQGYFSHTSQDGRSMKQRIENAGYRNWSTLGENLAAGQTIPEVTKSWLKSPSHCATIMDPALKEVGVGYVYKPGSKFGTYWVQDFGTR